MASDAPKVVELYDGAIAPVPGRTTVLNPDRARSSVSLYFIWAKAGGGEIESLEEALANEDTPLFAWLTDDDISIDVYKGSPEAMDALSSVIGRLDFDNGGWTLAMAEGFTSGGESMEAQAVLKVKAE